eukprot:snap_masked-scaffold_5-processed-gene-19.38-mRNA-1 protein AED:1.00 eAED:1.00 QI:0/0/0/0/1/1/2/0/135
MASTRQTAENQSALISMAQTYSGTKFVRNESRQNVLLGFLKQSSTQSIVTVLGNEEEDNSPKLSKISKLSKMNNRKSNAFRFTLKRGEQFKKAQTTVTSHSHGNLRTYRSTLFYRKVIVISVVLGIIFLVPRNGE